MLVRHFGHGVGHLKYERQKDPEIVPMSDPMCDDGQDNGGTSKTKESVEQDDAEEPGSEGDPVVDRDGSSDGESEDIEDGDNDSNCNSEDLDDDGGYASL